MNQEVRVQRPVCQVIVSLMPSGDIHIGGDADVEIVSAMLQLALTTVPAQAAAHYLKRMLRDARRLAVVSAPPGAEGGRVDG